MGWQRVNVVPLVICLDGTNARQDSVTTLTAILQSLAQVSMAQQVLDVVCVNNAETMINVVSLPTLPATFR